VSHRCVWTSRTAISSTQVIDLPDHRVDRPNRNFIEWHLDEVFEAS
jgi:hypothetical protein